MDDKCKICDREEETRMGGCWECVEAEAIIAAGHGFDDKPIERIKGYSESMAKVKALLNKGWTPPSSKGPGAK